MPIGQAVPKKDRSDKSTYNAFNLGIWISSNPFANNSPWCAERAAAIKGNNALVLRKTLLKRDDSRCGKHRYADCNCIPSRPNELSVDLLWQKLAIRNHFHHSVLGFKEKRTEIGVNSFAIITSAADTSLLSFVRFFRRLKKITRRKENKPRKREIWLVPCNLTRRDK